MTAYPAMHLVDYEDGFKTTVTVEKATDCDAEDGAVSRMTIVTDDRKEYTIKLSREAARALIRELRRCAR